MRKDCIQVEQRLGEQLRILLVEKGLLDADFPITKKDKQLFFPLQRSIAAEELSVLVQKIGPLVLVQKDITPTERKPPDLVTALEEKLPADLVESIPHSLDIIGTIAIVELDPKLTPYETEIGDAIREVNSRVVTVFAKEGGVEGMYRVRPLRLITGKDQSTTVHTEYGIKLAVDVAQTYFSPRLGTEHDRVTQLIEAQEVIIDMFTGVGPFALLAAKRQPVTVYAIDVNEQAIQCLKKSLTLNRLAGEIVPLIGDARKIIEDQLEKKANRVIMNLPHNAFDYLDVAATAISPSGGIIHFYGITTETRSLETLCEEVIVALGNFGRKATISGSRIVRPFAPHEFQVVIDLQVTPENTTRVT
ncbi:MAG: class I SAM-dependent methyltransferase family protein [Candidatus Hermodarchaeota archaeon]|nr:class I SAM-dependent methyltransferase family protein [Candidatus Hermodarchaeota archaeon]